MATSTSYRQCWRSAKILMKTAHVIKSNRSCVWPNNSQNYANHVICMIYIYVCILYCDIMWNNIDVYLNVKWFGVRPKIFFTVPCCESSSPSDFVPGSFSCSPNFLIVGSKIGYIEIKHKSTIQRKTAHFFLFGCKII